MKDIDKLISSAKPAVSAQARARVLEHARAHGAVALAPVPLRVSALWRVAALIMLALGAGVVSALVTPSPAGTAPDFTVTDLRAEIAELSEGVSTLEQLAELEARVDALQAASTPHDFDARLQASVQRVVEQREARRNQEWRERHVGYVRARFAEDREATVARLKTEVGLTPEQEAEVVALLEDAGRQAEALIGEYYSDGSGRRGRRHGGHRVHDKFEALAASTEEKLVVLLDEQQRGKLEGGLVSAEPADWAPSEDFRDGVDMDVWMNWMNVSRE